MSLGSWVIAAIPVVWAGFTWFAWWEATSALVLLAAGALLGRRWPVAPLAIALTLWVTSLLTHPEYPEMAMLPLLPATVLAGYGAGVRDRDARPTLIMLAAGAVVLGVAVPDLGTRFFAVLGVAVLGLLPWCLGRYRRQHLALVEQGWDLARRLEHEQQVVAAQARQRERARLAGDMHDLLGHELGLIGLRIGALEVSPDLDPRHREAAGAARSAVTDAAERLADIVSLLREDPEPPSITELVRRNRDSGLVVEFGLSGSAPPLVERTIYRVVREALTNAAKHAPGSAVRVRVSHGDGTSTVTVHNGLNPSEAPGGGQGLIGLAERIRLVGGEFRAGPVGPEFEVYASVPHEPVVVEPLAESTLDVARARVRRSLVHAVSVAGVTVVGAVGVVLAFLVYDAGTSVLSPRDFDRLVVGQALDEVRSVLPARTRVETPPSFAPPAPPGAECRYYGTHGNPFVGGRLDLYRLCFAGTRLVAKDFVEGKP
ncbi:histidine kinase [Allokutzneria sp. A3M-2-11 16]|uniref:sensor histidine kinase n=1 Tax=Allokutzneria sp. A3M-2-11 16 TaxID=2962043 RepID=UPI0020B8B876|nr:histidine kinase [Allokutzneria sp. A3M-2-11 16]MCP3803274.1 histidine kinase [Allokutzneria sp. A3M-2-11 16]